MTMRMDYLLELYERDFGGNPEKIYWQRWELKFWQECILRGEFDFVDEGGSQSNETLEVQ